MRIDSKQQWRILTITCEVSRDPGLTFVALPEVRSELVHDASSRNLKSDWYWENDFYSAFLSSCRRPKWHGRNFDALRDSIAGGGINKIEVPYRIVIRDAPRGNKMVKRVLSEFTDLIRPH